MPALDLHIQSLLGRRPLEDVFDIGARLKDTSVLVTGAGGSIGSALCHRIAQWKPTRVLVYEASEYALYQIVQALQKCQTQVIPVLGNLSDVKSVQHLLESFGVQHVFHAAGYKHVPLVEQNPIAGLRNNVWGTKVLVEAASMSKISSVLVVSTDKAVNPTNVMGASKRLAEYVTLSLCAGYRVVRFGNVLGSSGSVLPLFYDQLSTRQPLTITHRDVSRYFMSIEEAVELMLQSIALPHSVLVLDMGVPVSIESMARRLADLMHVESPQVVYTGLRPGEKLHEELTLGECLEPTEHPYIKAAREEVPALTQVTEWLRDLDRYCHHGDVGRIRTLLQEIVPGYHPSCGIMDHVWLQEYVVAARQQLDDCYKDTR